MKQQLNDWESEWMSARRREQLATERQQLEQEKYAAGWRRNLVVAALVVAGLGALFYRHFA